MTTQHITLLLPGLFDFIGKQPRDMPRFTALETLLARADQSLHTADSYYPCVLEQFDTDVDPRDMPVAAVSRYADSKSRDHKIWMHVDPVYLFADKDRLIVQGSSILGLDVSEANALIQELNTIYADDGWQFEYFHPGRWYVSLPHKPESRFHALPDVLGRSVEPFLPRGNDQIHWHRFMNEVQMLFHASSVNQERALQNKYPVNSVWCWGPGKIPEQVGSHWDAVYADEPFVKGLAMLSDTPVDSLPILASKIIEDSSVSDKNHERHTLVVMESSEEDILSLEINQYIEKLTMLEQNWFEPLLQAMKNNSVASISLLTCNGVKYSLNKNHLRRFWRKRKAISLSNTEK